MVSYDELPGSGEQVDTDSASWLGLYCKVDTFTNFFPERILFRPVMVLPKLLFANSRGLLSNVLIGEEFRFFS